MFRTTQKVNCNHRPYNIICPVCRSEDVLWTNTPRKCWMCGKEYELDMLAVIHSVEDRIKHHFYGKEGVPNVKDHDTGQVSRNIQNQLPCLW